MKQWFDFIGNISEGTEEANLNLQENLNKIMEGVRMPPCIECKHWRPRINIRTFKNNIAFDGITCCHAENMHHDFSCYIERAE